MNNKNEQMSWREVFQLSFRGIQTLFEYMPQLTLSMFIVAIWRAITPYIGIRLSALIISELAGNRDTERLMRLVLITLGSAAFVGFGNAWLTKWRETINCNGYFRRRLIFAKKLLSMDFCSVDDTKTKELKEKINRVWSSSGWGLTKLRLIVESLLSAVCSILGGIALTVTLFTNSVPETAGAYTILNHPLFLLLLIGVMFGIIFLAPVFTTKANSYMAKFFHEQVLSEMLFRFFDDRMREKIVGTDVRLYRQDRFCEKVFSNKNSLYGWLARLSRGAMGLYKAAGSAVSVVFTGVAYAFVCLKAWAGAFGVGEVTQYVASITKVATGVSLLIEKLGDLRNNAPFLKTEFEFLDIPNNMYQGSLTVEKRRDRNYEIEFRNVSFKYPGAENYALRNVNMKFKVGQRLAVVGMNGSGKTTFIKLLCRLYDPTEGEILLNGINIRKYNYLDYLSIFSVVFQDFKLFAFELGENVAGSTTYDEARVRDCLIKAGFGDRLKALPKGIHTYLYKNFDKEGVDISGGEAQKIALARTLYKDAPFIILDEPTAALDPVAEAEVYSKFNEIVGDKTAIYISHRLSSCRFCDEIVVFDHGAVVQQGSHDVLVADESGKYHELWYAQAQYYV